jgi:hypothetical protein
MKKILFILLIVSLVLVVSSCKRSDVNERPWDDPAGFNIILEGTANPAVLFIDGVIHASQINVAVTDINGNPLAGRTILFEQYDSAYAQIAWGYFENALATIEKLTDGAGRVSATFYGPTSLLGTQMYVRALMVVNDRSYGINLPQDMISLTLSRTNYQNYGPAVTLTEPIDGATVSGSVTVTATAIDEDGVAQVECYIDGNLLGTLPGSTTSDTYTFTWDSTKVDNGTHKIKVIAYDVQGKKGQDEITVEVSGNNIAPVVTITAPPDNAVVSGTSVSISAVATDAADGIQTVECYVDGGLIGSLSGSTTSDTYTFTWDTTQYSNSDHTVTVTAIDNSGMSASDSVRVTVNNTAADAAPTVSISYPTTGSTITLPSGETTLTIRANAEDDRGVNRVELFVNDVFEARMSRSNTLYRYTYTVPASGTYTFYAIAYDTINQMTTSATVTVTITLTP